MIPQMLLVEKTIINAFIFLSDQTIYMIKFWGKVPAFNVGQNMEVILRNQYIIVNWLWGLLTLEETRAPSECVYFLQYKKT